MIWKYWVCIGKGPLKYFTDHVEYDLEDSVVSFEYFESLSACFQIAIL